MLPHNIEIVYDKSSLHNFTQCAVLPHNIEIVLRQQITVTSLHTMYTVVFITAVINIRIMFSVDALILSVSKMYA